MREIINISIEDLPHHSSEASGSMTRRAITAVPLSSLLRSAPPTPAPSVKTASRPSIQPTKNGAQTAPPPTTKPPLPPRPSFGRRQRFSSTFTQIATGIARVQAQPHKPKRPSPLHISISPMSDTETDAIVSENESSSSSTESTPELCHIEVTDGLGVIKEEKNMLGLELGGATAGWNWYGDIPALDGPRTPFPSPAIYA